jgi:hypothetical protein
MDSLMQWVERASNLWTATVGHNPVMYQCGYFVTAYQVENVRPDIDRIYDLLATERPLAFDDQVARFDGFVARQTQASSMKNWWCVSSRGQVFVVRAYVEDFPNVFGSIRTASTPPIRSGQLDPHHAVRAIHSAIVNAKRFYGALTEFDTIQFHLEWKGLGEREMWFANSQLSGRATSNMAESKESIAREQDDAESTCQLVRPLYEVFDKQPKIETIREWTR